MRVDVVRLENPGPLPPRVDLAAYRIVQEALTNVRRHAGVDEASVTLTYGPRELGIEVSDAGAGAWSGRQQRDGGPWPAGNASERQRSGERCTPDLAAGWMGVVSVLPVTSDK